MENEQKSREYFFSYKKIHDELKHELSCNYERYKDVSELDILCSWYLGAERVGDYSEVEWHQFGISAKTLPQLIAGIDNSFESLRVLVYFRDHPAEILGEEADTKSLQQFERSCCKAISDIMQQYAGQKEVEGTPWARVIEYGYWHEYNEMEDLALWGKGNQELAKHIPYHFSSEVCYGPFPVNAILSTAITKHYHLVTDISETAADVKEENPAIYIHIGNFADSVRDRLIWEQQHFLPKGELPLMQALFAISVYLLTERDKEYKEERLKPLYKEISDLIINYIKEKWPKESFMIERDRENALEALKGMNYLDFARTDEYFVEEPKIETTTSDATEQGTVLNTDGDSLDIPKVRIAKLKEVYKALADNLGKKFKGGSQWFYVYKLMADNKTYEDRSYKKFINDLQNIGMPQEVLPNPDTFTRKYNQLAKDCRYPYWRVKSGGKQATLDEGMEIARIAFDILYK